VFAPIVEMDIKYKRPVLYGMKPHIRITYRPKPSAKIVFDYEIFDPKDGSVFLTARTVQVFMDMNYQLMWDNPPFFVEWKNRWQQ
jgi:acyl-CoA thioester hydrolase